ncbi:uncharacterized protein LOC127752255 [Frankliniella occidentalis]|uniref:Uncharacterized protein LOC127752255 n=1 Tax=Frankliniella occidentalis TaxID=133901 RepID=A0A9C6XWB3_FRAOC|nr:uncharacterized protein LOC127752255 [Frankliniella occidentalis]
MSAGDKKQELQELVRLFASANENALRNGADVEDLYAVFLQSQCRPGVSLRKRRRGYGRVVLSVTVPVCVVLVGLILAVLGLFSEDIVNTALGVRCVVPNNFLVWEATRPIADCNICRGITDVLQLHNVSRLEFEKYAYSYQPILVKGAAADWPAIRTFSYDYFKKLYESTEGAYESVEDECQLLTFKTEFLSLKDVFSMSRSRVLNLDGEQPWYIGWSNCHPSILAGMRREYARPQFLPLDAEHAHHDFIFMGYSQGAAMHLDYISRLMWQAQLKGHKTWMLTPPPECEHVCSSFSFRAAPGDVVLLDTRQWYHKTQIDEKEFSLTVSSEYG